MCKCFCVAKAYNFNKFERIIFLFTHSSTFVFKHLQVVKITIYTEIIYKFHIRQKAVQFLREKQCKIMHSMQTALAAMKFYEKGSFTAWLKTNSANIRMDLLLLGFGEIRLNPTNIGRNINNWM